MRRREFREIMDAIHEEHRLHRVELERHRTELEQHRVEFSAAREEQVRRFNAIDAGIENDRRVTREMVVELREGREILHDIRDGIRASTEGLMRVLDEFRRGDGPAGASA